jgi:hypothetical protein
MLDAINLATIVAMYGDERREVPGSGSVVKAARHFLAEAGHFIPDKVERRAFLVYHTKDAGPGRKRIPAASVFAVTSFNLADFGREAQVMVSGGQWIAAHYFAQGLGASGWIIRTAHYHGTDPVETAQWEGGDGGIYADLKIN